MNDAIRAREVRLVTDEGNVGIIPIHEALRRAEEAGWALGGAPPNATPPVCKIMDFGKFQYEQAKKERLARKQQKQIEVKEIRLRPKTTDHHLSFKIRDARRWLEDGMKVKVRVRFRGREITYPEIAREQMDRIISELDDVAAVEQQPAMEGRTMLMVLAPAKEDD
mgnify:CR=1 FL=1